MKKYEYSEFFKKYPEIYNSFHRIVHHSENFYQELKNRDLLNVKSVLSIGSGEGELEARAANDLGIKVGVVEPSLVFMQSFKDRLKTFGKENLCLEDFSGFFQNYSSALTYDLVISIHSWYAFLLNREILEKALACLKPGGKLFVTIVSRSSLIWKTARLASNDAGGDLSSESLSEWATNECFEHKYFVNYRRIPSHLIFKNSAEFTTDGKQFVTFPTFCPWEELGSDMQKSIVELFRESIVDQNIILENGCLLFTKK